MLPPRMDVLLILPLKAEDEPGDAKAAEESELEPHVSKWSSRGFCHVLRLCAYNEVSSTQARVKQEVMSDCEGESRD